MRAICARMKQTKQMEQETHSLFGNIPASSRLKSRKYLMTSMKPLNFLARVARSNEWPRRLRDKSRLGMVNLNDEPAKGYDIPWLTRRCLNRLRIGYTFSKEQMKKWVYFNGDTTCACGLGRVAKKTVHMLRCFSYQIPVPWMTF